MISNLTRYNTIESFIEDIEKQSASRNPLPEDIVNEISLHPEWAIDFLQYLEGNDSLSMVRMNAIFLLLEESLSQVRYSIDRKDKKGESLRDGVEKIIHHILPSLSHKVKIALNQVIYDTKLPIEINEDIWDEAVRAGHSSAVDIMPRLPELLDQLRRENSFKTAFELYEIFLPQIQIMPTQVQLSIIAELAHSKKPIIHEVATLMLLHPKAVVRKHVAKLLYHLSGDKVFTAIDLRRLIMLRNWVPQGEREDIDQLILHLKRSKLNPAPYTVVKNLRLLSSCIDGAGAVSIMMEAKVSNQRKIAAFLGKIGAGIRDTWTMQKAPKNYFDSMLAQREEENIALKPVSKGYVNKVVRHFLSEAIRSGEVSAPSLLEVAEIFGANKWYPESMSWADDVEKLITLHGKEWSDDEIKMSLRRSGGWHLNKDFASHWFESGEIAEQAIINATEKHRSNSSESLEEIAIDFLMNSNNCLDKWKTIFLITALWMLSDKKHRDATDILVVLRCLKQDIVPSRIPLIRNMGTQSVATVVRRGFMG